MRKKKVFIVGEESGFYTEYTEMFLENNWETVYSIKDADLVQFTGGADVTPSFYNECAHKTTHTSPERDRKEALTFNVVDELKIPMAGICRGGQFLNVMKGGSMWQDVDGHARHNGHIMDCSLTEKQYTVTSTHHQLMRPAEGLDKKLVEVTGIAYETTRREKMISLGRTGISRIPDSEKHPGDPEIICYYGNDIGSNILCFQPHPEFAGHTVLKELYFEYLSYLVT